MRDVSDVTLLYVSVALHQLERTNIGSVYAQSIGSCVNSYVYVAINYE